MKLLCVLVGLVLGGCEAKQGDNLILPKAGGRA